MTEKELIEIELRADKATKGPWVRGYWSGQCHLDHSAPGKANIHGQGLCKYDYKITTDNNYFRNYVSSSDPELQCEIVGGTDYGPMLCDQDADFISHAREDIPKLLAEIRRLKTGFSACGEKIMEAATDLAIERIILWQDFTQPHGYRPSLTLIKYPKDKWALELNIFGNVTVVPYNKFWKHIEDRDTGSEPVEK